MAQDYAQAADWYRKAAEQGNAAARPTSAISTLVARACRRTTRRRRPGTARPPIRAARRRKTTSAICIADGHGVAQDFVQAMTWYRRAADQGYARAQNEVGDLYANGQACRATTRRR